MVTHQKTIVELIEELTVDLLHPTQSVTFMEHIYVASWQQVQYNQLKNNLPMGWLLLVMDFAKNRTVHHQDEIKSAFFGQRQITNAPYRNKYK